MKELILDKETWTPPLTCKDGFEFEVQVLDYAPYKTEITKKSIRELEVGTCESYRRLVNALAEEWANTMRFSWRAFEREGYIPRDRKHMVELYEKVMHEEYIKGADHPWLSINGNLNYHHYAGEMGFDYIGSEIGCLIKSFNMQMAFNRGAARQYGKPWFVDVSPWFDDYSMLDYSGASIWGVASGPRFGHTLSFSEREYYLCYMAGASQITAEAGINFFYPETDKNGNYLLSPLGEIGKSFYEFTKRNPDIGIPYTPFALMLDYYHGVNYGSVYQGKAFETFPYEKGDWLTYNILQTVYPGCWETWGKKEVGSMVNGPFGDSFDVLLQTASLKVLKSYPAVVISGNLELTEEQKNNLLTYTREGGTLIVNTAYVDMLGISDESGAYGDGRIFVYGPDYSVHALPRILKQLTQEYMPFELDANIHYMVNVKENGLILTLMNHDGVSKDYREDPVIDYSKTRTVNIVCKEQATLTSVVDIYNQKILSTSKEQKVTLQPGEISIIEFTF